MATTPGCSQRWVAGLGGLPRGGVGRVGWGGGGGWWWVGGWGGGRPAGHRLWTPLLLLLAHTVSSLIADGPATIAYLLAFPSTVCLVRRPALPCPALQSRSKLYSWKALRAVARTNLQAFAAVSCRCCRCRCCCRCILKQLSWLPYNSERPLGRHQPAWCQPVGSAHPPLSSLQALHHENDVRLSLIHPEPFPQAVQKGGDLEVAARAMYPSECPPPPATPPAPPKAEGEGKGGAMPAHPSGGAPADTTAATARRRGSDGGGEEAAGEEDGAVNGKAAGAAAAGEEGEEGEEGELPEDGEATAAHLEGEEEAEEGEAVVDAVAPMDAE